MSTLWGSKKQDDEHGDEQPNRTGDRPQQHYKHHNHHQQSSSRPTSRPSSRNMREPTERDRLLPANPRPPHTNGYLDIDDPAVSPYNLWSVRFTRYLCILFLAITFLWWVLLLVSIFVSPPGLHTRGSGFFDFGYTSLVLGILINALLFFSAPSLSMRVCQSIIGLFLLVDMIIIAAVPRLRAEEGSPGLASVVWATFIAAFCIFTDRLVAYGKREEEERLTGRPETRRTVKEWLSVLTATTILLAFIAITILMTTTLIIRSLDAGLAYEGSRIAVDDGKFKVHLACVGESTLDADGNRSPTILLEAGEDPVEYDFEHWAYATVQNKTIDRYCYWDRPGYAWSDNAPSPHSAGMAADNLREALALQGEEGPWILISSGYGSIVSRIFSARNFRSVVGIMLVDPLHESYLGEVGSSTRGFLIWGWGIISPLGLRRIIGSIFGGQTRQDRVYGSSAFLGGKFIKARLQENLVATSFTKNEVASARTIQDSETPLVVISSGIRFQKDKDWADKQKGMTGITGKLLSWDVVNKAPHYVWKTRHGSEIMEKRLGELVEAHHKSSKDHSSISTVA